MTDTVGQARLTRLGATPRQIQLWSTLRYLSSGNPGSGVRRTFTDRDAATAIILLESGGSALGARGLGEFADPLLDALDDAGWPQAGWLVVGSHGWDHVDDDGLAAACRRHQPARTINLTRLTERAAP